MSLYDMCKLLRDSGFELKKSSKFVDIWVKKGHQLTIPTNRDRIPDLLARRIKLQIKAVR